MVTVLRRRPESPVADALTLRELPAALDEKDSTIWVDLVDPAAEEWRGVLFDIFHFHQLAVEDAITDINHPKIDDYGEYLYLVVHGARYDTGRRQIKTEELDIFLGPNYLVTHHKSVPAQAEDHIAESMPDPKHMRAGSDMVLAGILERLMDQYMELLDQLDSEMEKIEEGAIRQEGAGMLPSIMDMRHSISNLRRVLGPQRETIGRLSRGDFAMIRPQNRLYFRDVFDQSVRIIDIVESARDVAAGLVEIYLTVASNRLNEIMRVLMVVSVIIMPLTLITGIYGMNVKVPIADSRWGFLDIVVVMGVTAGLLIWYFRKKKWL